MLPLVISYPSTGLVGVGWPSTAFGGPGTGWPLAYSVCGIQPGVRVGFGSTDAAPPISVSWAFGSSTLLSLKRKSIALPLCTLGFRSGDKVGPGPLGTVLRPSPACFRSPWPAGCPRIRACATCWSKFTASSSKGAEGTSL